MSNTAYNLLPPQIGRVFKTSFPKRPLILALIISTIAIIFYYYYLRWKSEPVPVFNAGHLYQQKPEYFQLNGPTIQATHQRVIEKLQRNFLIYPSNLPYNLRKPFIEDPSVGQSQIIRKLFEERENGFFIECGALDGEIRSNTLFLERYKSWTGLLIEADPLNYAVLKRKNRRSYLSNTCLSAKPYPVKVAFEQNKNMGRISQSYEPGVTQDSIVDAQCFPFETFMLALNRTQLDYFSLDVEGLEFAVLKTINFEKYDISTLSVEYIHDVEGKIAINEFMVSNGYFVLTEVTHPNNLANDYIFVKTEFYKKLSKRGKETVDGIRNEYFQNGAIVSTV